jgi:hypothetical protein
MGFQGSSSFVNTVNINFQIQTPNLQGDAKGLGKTVGGMENLHGGGMENPHQIEENVGANLQEHAAGWFPRPRSPGNPFLIGFRLVNSGRCFGPGFSRLSPLSYRTGPPGYIGRARFKTL